MFEIKCNNHIRLTRGDTAYITLDIVDVGTKQRYDVELSDTITLSVKRDVDDTSYAFQKIITGDVEIKLLPSDTKNLECGYYKYDVQLETSTGDIHTVIPLSVFELLDEVTE